MELQPIDDEEVELFEEEPAKPPKRPTTPAQRAARRENGRKGGASKQTPEGRARSDEARVTHGAYAHKIPVIQRGPLREDPEEAKNFKTRLIEAYAPATSLERVKVDDIVNLRWRRERAVRYEAGGLSALGSEHPVSMDPRHMIWLRTYEVGRTALKELFDREVSTAELKEAASLLTDHPGLGAGAWDGVPEDPTREEYLSFIKQLIDEAFGGDLGTAMAWADNQAEQLAQEVATDLARAADEASRAAVTDGFMTNLTRIDSHLDRAIKRAEDQLEALRALRSHQPAAREE